MRPANLIPPEERHVAGSGLRAAPVAYIIVAALLLAIGAMALLTTTGNQISEHKTEVAAAERQTATAEARVGELAAYTEFHAATEARVQAITNLANSRFGWEKIMRQMALVQPSDIKLSSLGASSRNGESVGGSESSSLRAGVAGPALSLEGCGTSLEAVANYVTELKDIEGVTRVGLQTTASVGGTEGASSVSASAGCKGKNAINFQAVAAFDAAPVPAAVEGGEAVVEAPVEEAPAGGEEAEGSEAAEGE